MVDYVCVRFPLFLSDLLSNESHPSVYNNKKYMYYRFFVQGMDLEMGLLWEFIITFPNPSSSTAEVVSQNLKHLVIKLVIDNRAHNYCVFFSIIEKLV
jgi:hypothetical protein